MNTSTTQPSDEFRLTVPVRILFRGDRVAAMSFVGTAHKEMAILESAMAFQGLSQGVRRSWVQPGVFIESRKRFGERESVITVVSGKVSERMYSEECLCNCNFSVGWIVEVQAEDIDGAPLYTVAACNFRSRYVIYEDILASDWCVYRVGQKVILVPYLQMSYLCCPTPAMDYGEVAGYGCRAEKSTELTSADEWRTAYRIIPWNAFTAPRRVNVRRSL